MKTLLLPCLFVQFAFSLLSQTSHFPEDPFFAQTTPKGVNSAVFRNMICLPDSAVTKIPVPFDSLLAESRGFTYDAHDRLVRHIHYFHLSTGTVIQKFDTMAYDSRGNIVMDWQISYQLPNGAVATATRRRFAYDTQNRQIANDLEKFDGSTGGYTFSNRWEYLYNGQETQPFELVGYEYSPSNGGWLMRTRSRFYHGPTGLVDSIHSFQLDGSVWSYSGDTKYTYNSDDSLLVYIQKNQAGDTLRFFSSYYSVSRDTSIHDSHFRIGGVLKQTGRTVYTFDSQGLLSTNSSPTPGSGYMPHYEYEYDDDNCLVAYDNYVSRDMGATYPFNSRTIIHNHIFTETKDVLTQDSLYVSCHPNPTHGNVTVTIPKSGGQILVFDMQGRIVRTSLLGPTDIQAEIDLSYLSPGIYAMVIIRPNGNILHQKIVRH